MNKEILKRYFEGQSSRWEKKQVQEYFEGDDMRIFDEYISDQEHQSPAISSDSSHKENFYSDLMGNIEQKESPKPVRRNLPQFLKMAASILLFSGIVSALYLVKEHSEKLARQPAYEIVMNTGRNLKKVQLSDGTSIWMNPGAGLKYDKKHFGDTTREVTLTGEAYFDVAHNAAKPFKVHAGGLTTRVLGTAFNIEAYRNEEKVRILLVRGSVRVASAITQNALAPGQVLEYNLLNRNITISPVDVSGMQEQFTSGKLVFENVSLRNVLSRLREAFGISITLTDTTMLSDKTITGSWFRNNPDETLRRILFIHGLKFKKKGEKSYVVTD